MRRSRDSVQDLGGGRYRVKITVGYDPATGKQRRYDRTLRCTKRDLPFEIERLHRECGTVSALTYGSLTVADFVRDVWLAQRRQRLRATTVAGYDATVRNHVEPNFSRTMMRDVSPLAIIPVLDRLSPGAALNVHKMLHAAFTLATRSGVLPANPMDMVERPRLPAYRADTYDLAETVRVLEVFRGSPIEPGVIIAATCGTRVSETCALDWADLTLDAATLMGEVHVRAGYHRVAGERLTTPTKTERSERVVAIPGFAVARLLEIRGAGRIGPLMTDATGQRMTPSGMSSRWRRMLLPRDDKRGRRIYEPPMRHIELKNLRHSQSTILLDLGATMREVSKRDGHSRESTTDTFYNRPKMTADHDVARRLDAAVRGAGEVVELGLTRTISD